MIDYNSWKRIKLSPTSIRLDDENLRLSGFDEKPNERQIIDYMVSNEKIYSLAKNIAQKGYFLNEEPIVYKDGNRYVVLEGNRRVTACKLLIQPNAAPKKRIRSFEKLSRGFDRELIRKLYCRVAPKREDADIIIENRHTNTEIERWDRIKQYRYYFLKYKLGKSIDHLANRFNRPPSEIIKYIRRYEMFTIAKKLPLDDLISAALEDETKLDATNLERFYESAEGKEFLGLRYDDKNKLQISIPNEEFLPRYSRVVEDFANKELTSRTYGNSKDQNNSYIDDLFSSDERLNSSIKPSKEFYISPEIEDGDNSKSEDQEPQKSNRGTKRDSSAKLIPKGWECNSEVERINRICIELQQLPLGTKANAAFILFRSFLEMVTYQFLYLNNEIDKIKKEAGEENNKINKKRAVKVIDYIVNEHGVKEVDIKMSSLSKSLVKQNLRKDWTPSLFRMLSHLAKEEVTLISNVKMKEALRQYLKLRGDILTHHDFNLFVHNEYSVTPSAREIVENWGGIKPLLKMMIESIDVEQVNKKQGLE